MELLPLNPTEYGLCPDCLRLLRHDDLGAQTLHAYGHLATQALREAQHRKHEQEVPTNG